MDNPIGIFDSGIGGLSILKKLKVLLPNENMVYLADNLNCPYGNKSKKEILSLSIKNCKKLSEFNCKVIIVACNTATTNSIKKLREIIQVPIIGVEPGLKPAIMQTETKNIGVLATEKTLESKLFNNTLNENTLNNVKIHEQIGFKLVKMLEDGNYTEKDFNKILKLYLIPMINKNIDYLVLGCTHYHYLIDVIKDIIPENIIIVDTISPINEHIYNTLKAKNILNKNNKKGNIEIFYNGKRLSDKYVDKEYNLNYLNF
tara:strand:- start:26 stop:802 length:777 start_codon:yes stop_codon:yes gene_type:complete